MEGGAACEEGIAPLPDRPALAPGNGSSSSKRIEAWQPGNPAPCEVCMCSTRPLRHLRTRAVPYRARAFELSASG